MNAAPRTALRAAGIALLAATAIVAAPRSEAAVQRAPVKVFQARRLAEEPMRERLERRELGEFLRERKRELRRLARAMKQDGRTSLRVRGESARPFDEDEDARAGLAPPARPARPLASGAVTAPPRANVRCNDTTLDGSIDGQCETAIVRWNDYLVAAWNDGSGFSDGTGQTQGWATSVDGGQTWVDHGTFPLPAGYTGWRWTSDPVLAVNPATGAFYYTGLSDPSASTSGIGVIKGRFNGASFAWGPVSVVRVVSTNAAFLDKQWLAVDPATGRTCVSYTEFVIGGDNIVAQAADSSLAAWSSPAAVSPASESGYVQGSRPIVEPGGAIDVVYYLIGAVDADEYRIARSTDGGLTFSPPATALSFYPNFGTGAPGFNRAMGIQFPSIAVDRSGAHNGRLYLSWAESLNWFDDVDHAGNLGSITESEPNDAFGAATPLVTGQAVSGTVSSSADVFDWYSIRLTAGQTLVVKTTALDPGLTIAMRMYATNGSTRLSYATAAYDEVSASSTPAWIYTAPSTGTYFLRVGSSPGSGAYTIATGAASRTTERGRDQRDAFTSWSDDHGASWSAPVRVSNSPPGFDDWLPEVAVGGDGNVYAAWYDWRNATANTNGGESNIYLARSSDGGASWAELGATSDAKTAWSFVQTNIIPNEGDYLSLFADADGLVIAWSDGRTGNPDVYMSRWSAAEAASLPALASATIVAGRAELRWRVGTPEGFAAELYRRPSGSATWDSLGTLRSSAGGLLSYTDGGVELGRTYDWRLGVMQGGTEHFYGEVTLTVGGSLRLLGAWPNPAGANGVIAFTLSSDAPATLELIDLNGRRVSSRAIEAGTTTVPLGDGTRLRPGIYFARLTQEGRTVSRRIVVL